MKHIYPPVRTWLDYIVYFVYLAAIGYVFLRVSDSNADQVREIQNVIVQTAKTEGIDPQLALAIAKVESQFDPGRVGSLGEIGVFQLRPEFHPVSTNQWVNIHVGIKYLARLKRQCSAYGDAYFVCFNYGQGRRLKYPKLFPYYKKVMLAKQQLNSNLIAKRD